MRAEEPPRGELVSTTLQVEGMFTLRCARRVTQLLELVRGWWGPRAPSEGRGCGEGQRSWPTQVHMPTEQASVSHTHQLKAYQLIRALVEGGYQAYPLDRPRPNGVKP